MTRPILTHYPVTDENGKTRLVPIKRRYDVSTELKRAGNANKARPASRRKAQSLPELERSDRGIDGR